MKITKVYTSSFTINNKTENRILDKKNAAIHRKYLPVAKFKVVRTHEVEKGVLFKRRSFDKTENSFYVDLTNCDLFYVHPSTPLTEPKIVRSDFLRRIIEYDSSTLSTLGALYEYGSIELKSLDRAIVQELAKGGFIEIYEPEANQIFNFIRFYLEDDIVMRKYFVRMNINLPNFDNKRYLLDSYLDMSDSVDGMYQKDSIRFSHERVMEVLGTLFNGSVLLKELTYMPYLEVVKKEKDVEKRDIVYPFCGKNSKDAKRDFKDGETLEPISFMTDMSAAGSVPIETSTINFSHVADLEEVKQEIREAIIYPLMRPDLSKKFQKKGGGSILFYGPPGCGKTYLARATVGECGVNFFNVNTSDIISGGAEDGAQNIHDVFMRASKNAPAILFFDEIDALGARRESVEGSTRIIVNQFLMEMDGIESLKENVLIIGSTNIPWALDPALRRSGRFTSQIFISPPNFETRAAIFKIHTRKKPIDSNINFEKLAELTEGYSSADVKSICDDALEIPWAEAIEGKPSRKVCMDDFLQVVNKREPSLAAWYKVAEKQIRDSGEVELYAKLSKYILTHAGGVDTAARPDISFKDVADLARVKELISRGIIYPLIKPELASKFGREVGGGILLYGPPGCGKTYVARATAGECKAQFFNIKITDIIRSSEGESEKRIKEIFERAAQNTPAILFFDEIDAIAARREDVSGTSKRIVNQLLSEMDGFSKKKGVMIIGSTNAPWDVDPAFRRAGRFTTQVYVPPPDFATRGEIFKLHTEDQPVEDGIDYDRLAEITEGFSSADIKAICDHAIEIPWIEAYHGGRERKVDLNDFMKVLKEGRPSLTPWFKLAEKQLKSSGEQEYYQELNESIEAAKHHTSSGKRLQKEIVEQERDFIDSADAEEKTKTLKELLADKAGIDDAVTLAKKRFQEGKIGENVFHDILTDYEKKIIELEIKIQKAGRNLNEDK